MPVNLPQRPLAPRRFPQADAFRHWAWDFHPPHQPVLTWLGWKPGASGVPVVARLMVHAWTHMAEERNALSPDWKSSPFPSRRRSRRLGALVNTLSATPHIAPMLRTRPEWIARESFPAPVPRLARLRA